MIIACKKDYVLGTVDWSMKHDRIDDAFNWGADVVFVIDWDDKSVKAIPLDVWKKENEPTSEERAFAETLIAKEHGAEWQKGLWWRERSATCDAFAQMIHNFIKENK